MLYVDDELYGNVTEEKLDELLQQKSSGE